MAETAPDPVDDLRLLNELLRPCGEAERQASWRRFVTRFSRLIAGCVRRVLVRYGAPCHNDDVDDIISEVWIALLSDDLHRLRAYDPERGCRVSTFIGLVATNLTIDKLRRSRIEALSLHDLPAHHRALQVMEVISKALEDRERAQMAQAAVARLSRAEQAFVAQIFCDERDPAQVAESLGINTTTVYTRKLKVRAKLRRFVDELAA